LETPLAEGDLPAGKPLGWGGRHYNFGYGNERTVQLIISLP